MHSRASRGVTADPRPGPMAAATVVHVTTAHWASDPRIFDKECRSLAEAGYDVAMVVPHERDEIVEGVRVLGVSHPADRGSRLVQTMRKAFRRARASHADIYHFHDPELIPVGLLLKASGRAVIYDVHEDLPRQILVKPWLPMRSRRAFAACAALAEGVSAIAFDAIVAATPTIAARFPAGKTSVVRNFPRVEEFACAAATPPERTSILTIGGISADRGARVTLEAWQEICQTGGSRGAQLVFAGICVDPALEGELRATTTNVPVEMHEWQSLDDTKALLCRARIGMAVLKRTANYERSLPTKLFEYMSSSVPVIASDFPLWRQIVGDGRCGLLVDPTDTTAVVQALEWLLDHPDDAREMGERGRRVALDRYNWAGESDRLLDTYRRVTDRRPRR